MEKNKAVRLPGGNQLSPDLLAPINPIKYASSRFSSMMYSKGMMMEDVLEEENEEEQENGSENHDQNQEQSEAYSPKIHSNSQNSCLLYTSPSPRDRQKSRMPSSA
eukprot:TRINITY_DN5156_c0_g1_i1.p2 TRINITY_DN5156_c0_g1~~TRINITY_DN5156_c0_g1_i1.p2  ORF type:complete len:106 (+),score=31.41 TRINITY_DN5156_c0_g1_i1:316-633(+)